MSRGRKRERGNNGKENEGEREAGWRLDVPVTTRQNNFKCRFLVSPSQLFPLFSSVPHLHPSPINAPYVTYTHSLFLHHISTFALPLLTQFQYPCPFFALFLRFTSHTKSSALFLKLIIT